MRLDEAAEDRRVGLDITPLIDVVFLLVLFFAVTTSFISPEDLAALEDRVVALVDRRAQLEAEADRLGREIALLSDTVTAQETTIVELRSALADRDASLADRNAELVALQGRLTLSLDDLEAERVRAGTLEQRIAGLLEQAAAARAAHDAQLAARDRTIGLRDTTIAEQEERLASLDQRLSLTLDQLDRATEEGEALAERMLRADEALATATERLAEVDAIADERDHLRGQVARLQDEAAAAAAEVARYRGFYEENESRIARAAETERVAGEALDSLIASDTLSLSRDGNRLTIALSNQILFDSGSAELNDEGLAVLRRLADVLRDRLAGVQVQIGGHTDNVPISGRFASNWELSAARAVNVVRFLEEVGLNPDQIAAVGYGEHRPIADNDTAAGRARNRRIEIVLVPG